MSGIYLHIPFCKKKCHYCNFYSIVSMKYRNECIDAITRELLMRKNYLQGETINSIYLGGGTPSLLEDGQLMHLFETITRHFKLENDLEISLEANPDDVDAAWLEKIQSTPVNRISLGVQSFHDDDLKYLNRIHTAKQAKDAIKLLKNSGFTNITIDLIYGIPGMDLQRWRDNLDYFYGLDIPHLSAYALTVEPNTALYKRIQNGRYQAVDEDLSLLHFEYLLETSQKNKYLHYEISNFAKQGYYSRHNSIYWLGGHYLGVGPSAHSYNGISRQWNISNLKLYLEGVQIDKLAYEKEILTPSQQFNEYVMTSIRTSWGCDLEHLANVFEDSYLIHLEKAAEKFLKNGWIKNEGNSIYLTNKGKFFADGITSELFVDDSNNFNH